ncbi:sialin-like isoform X2 [Mytilus trossulus]|uniref:sialin-like isoform X2 n=1 Tax=Mytilus trossulus TaxID=6551 RepID=UPI0030045D6C
MEEGTTSALVRNGQGEVDIRTESIHVPLLGSCRFALAVLGFFGLLNMYAMLVNINVAIVCMVNRTSIYTIDNSTVISNKASNCFRQKDHNFSDESSIRGGELNWDPEIQGYVLGGFYWGYLITQMPAGWIATRYGGKMVTGLSMFVSLIFTLLTPFAARTSFIFAVIVRIVIGLSTGAVFPAMHSLLGNWVPPSERSKFTAMTYSGTQLGIVVTFALGSLMCAHGFAGGWPSIFYVCGITSFIWLILWMWFVSDTPAEHKRISREEKEYIMGLLADSTHDTKKKELQVPWLEIAKSMPNYAIVVSNITCDWGLYTLLTYIPTYMNDVLKLDITTNGLFSSLPYIVFWATVFCGGWLADFFRSRKLMSTTNTRKVFDTVAKLGPASMLIGLGYVDCSQTALAIVLVILAVSSAGFQYSGWVVNHIDIAPSYAGILLGISNSLASTTGIISPIIVGAITEKSQTRAEWQIVFYIAAGMYIFGAIFYIIFASGELQPWAKESCSNPSEEESTDNFLDNEDGL